MIETLFFAAPVAIRAEGSLTCDLSVAVKCKTSDAAVELAEHMTSGKDTLQLGRSLMAMIRERAFSHLPK
jgi:hypothetical protein